MLIAIGVQRSRFYIHYLFRHTIFGPLILFAPSYHCPRQLLKLRFSRIKTSLIVENKISAAILGTTYIYIINRNTQDQDTLLNRIKKRLREKVKRCAADAIAKRVFRFGTNLQWRMDRSIISTELIILI